MTLILPLLPFVPLQAESYNELDYGQYYGYASDPSIVGAAALAAHDPYFGRMRAEAIKAPHGHFQHIAPADPGDDFPYAEFKEYAAVELAVGQPLLATSTYAGKRRPVLFSWSLELDASNRPTTPAERWAQAVDLRNDRYIQFFIDMYVRRTLWRPRYSNYWVMVDNCSFRYDLYGVLDDDGVFRAGVPWDPPFATNESEFLDSVVYFLRRLKQLAPDIRIMGNEGSLTHESEYPRIWAGFDGSVREDITAGFRSDPTSRDQLYTFYRRYQYLAGAGKAAILRSLQPNPGDPEFQDKLRTSYVTYLLFRGTNFFYGPRFDDGSVRGVPPSAYSEMRDRLGSPVSQADDRAFGAKYLRLYSRRCEGGIVFLNYSGTAQRIVLPEGYYDREGTPISAVTIGDMQGDYVLNARDPRAERPLIMPNPSGPVSGPLKVAISASVGAMVRCTLDGSEPRANSPACAGVLEVDKNTRLRARTFAPGLKPSFTASADFEVQSARPRVEFCSPAAQGSDAKSTAYALVCLSCASGSQVKVDWAVTGGTALEGKDYVAAASSFLFSPGERYKYIPIGEIRSNRTDDATVKITLSHPSGALLGKYQIFTYTISANRKTAVLSATK